MGLLNPPPQDLVPTAPKAVGWSDLEKTGSWKKTWGGYFLSTLKSWSSDFDRPKTHFFLCLTCLNVKIPYFAKFPCKACFLRLFALGFNWSHKVDTGLREINVLVKMMCTCCACMYNYWKSFLSVSVQISVKEWKILLRHDMVNWAESFTVWLWCWAWSGRLWTRKYSLV